jgi:endonuclease/exonuclease/phosphatase family metal-dependent hydrolase
MPFYKKLSADNDAGKRTINKLLELRKALDEIPERSQNSNLLLATWNIREFDSTKYGDRTEESYYYIAEIIDRFDIIAVQEVREDLRALDKLMDILGGNWQRVFTDITEGTAGNGERMAFLFDTRKVKFSGLMGQVVLPPIISKDANGKRITIPPEQLARTPLMCGFRAGWTDFILTTVHIYYGSDKADDPRRVEEISQLANFLSKRADEPTAWSKNWLLLGDFNIYDPGDVTMQAITKAGFVVPKELQRLPSNIGRNKFYDQIAFKVRPDRFATRSKAGVFNFFDFVFKDDEEAVYVAEMGEGYQVTKQGEARTDAEKKRYYRDWRTFQISDHLPMWVELQIDYSDDYLERKLNPPA